MYKYLLQTIGNTPLIEINLGGTRILAKLEFLNPGGSIKDRMAIFMVEMAEKRGDLKPGMTIIEATTGNTGISFAMIAAVKNYRMIAVMPENMSFERRQLIEAFGAKVILTSAKEGPRGAIKRRNELARQTKQTWIPGQFENFDNVLAYEKLGREIIKQTKNNIDVFVAGIGTGGTLIGVARILKKKHLKTKIIAVEPVESPILSGGRAGDHGIQGIGEGFIPKIVDLKLINEVEKVSTTEAKAMAENLALQEGILAGVSSGANVVAALRVAKRLGRSKIVVTVLPDRGERYFSQNVFN